MMAGAFVLYVMGRATANPELAPTYDVKHIPLRQRIRPFIVYVVPLFSIFVVVVGSMLMGVATPTESAALGSVACIIIAASYGTLTLSNLLKSLEETAKVSIMILFIIVASSTFAQILALSGATQGLLSLVSDTGLSRLTVLIGMLAILMFLGMFMDGVSMMLITLPLYIPLATVYGMDLVWFGTLMLIVVEISLLTPPFGLLLFTMKAVAPPQITLREVILAALPYILQECMVLGCMVAFPDMVLWLPRLI
jgi:tripartite ATP-independent transporter DctM subunit